MTRTRDVLHPAHELHRRIDKRRRQSAPPLQPCQRRPEQQQHNKIWVCKTHAGFWLWTLDSGPCTSPGSVSLTSRSADGCISSNSFSPGSDLASFTKDPC